MSWEHIIEAVHEEMDRVKRDRVEDPFWLDRYNELRSEQSTRMREVQLKRSAQKKQNS